MTCILVTLICRKRRLQNGLLQNGLLQNGLLQNGLLYTEWSATEWSATVITGRPPAVRRMQAALAALRLRQGCLIKKKIAFGSNKTEF